MISAFPKIFAIGTDYISNIFDDEVEITEKIDGSQFAFGKINGELFLRSKGAQLYVDNPEKMFLEGIEHVQAIEDRLPDNVVYYCEYLKKPKHNVLAYDRVPNNHLILFGVMKFPSMKFESRYEFLKEWADGLNIDVVPRIYKGKINNPEELLKMLETESCLGGQKIEGVVVKNYVKPFLLGGQPIPLMAGKHVSEAFKEVHNKSWKGMTSRGKWDEFKAKFRTEARWDKAIQHLRDKDELENSPRDIGKLLKEVQIDITEEEKETITKFLWNEFGKEVIKGSTRGFPEYYKKKLLEKSFEK